MELSALRAGSGMEYLSSDAVPQRRRGRRKTQEVAPMRSLLAFIAGIIAIVAAAALRTVARQLNGAVSRAGLGLAAVVSGLVLFAH